MSRFICVGLVLACFLVAAAPLEAALVQDTFSRPDGSPANDSLGVTEVGAIDWQERDTFGIVADVAAISGNQIYVRGTGGSTTNAQAILPVNLPDGYVSADLRFELSGTTVPGTARTTLGFVLREANTAAYIADAANTGLLAVQFTPTGGLYVAERQTAAFTGIYSDNRFSLGNAPVNYLGAGGLPTTVGGAPFDANGNGYLEPTETFNLSAVLMGDILQVRINDRRVALIKTQGTGTAATNAVALLKNHYGGPGPMIAQGYFDNLVVDAAPSPPIAVDTFTRANNTALGVAELGGQAWHERLMNGGATTVPSISGNRLLLGTNQQAILDVNVPQIVATADLTFQLPAGPGTAGQGGGFTLRKPSLGAAINNPDSAGQVAIQVLPTGAIYVNEQQGGSYVTLYGENPWSGAVGYPDVIAFPSPGTLPQFINGLPFDLNQDGRLSGDAETFELGAVLAHHDLLVQINGQTILSLDNILGGGSLGENYFSVLKNNWAGTLATTVYYDNVFIQAWVPEPGTFALLGLGFAALPVAAWRRRRRNRSKEV